MSKEKGLIEGQIRRFAVAKTILPSFSRGKKGVC